MTTQQNGRFRRWWRLRGKKIAAGTGIGLACTVTFNNEGVPDVAFVVDEAGEVLSEEQGVNLTFHQRSHPNTPISDEHDDAEWIWRKHKPWRGSPNPMRKSFGDAPRHVVDAAWKRLCEVPEASGNTRPRDANISEPADVESASAAADECSTGQGSKSNAEPGDRPPTLENGTARNMVRIPKASVLDEATVMTALMDSPESKVNSEAPYSAWLHTLEGDTRRVSVFARSAETGDWDTTPSIFLSKELGRGATAVVYQSEIKGRPVAIKMSQDMKNYVNRGEAIVMGFEPHKALCAPIAMLEIEENNQMRVASVIPFCKGGDLYHLIASRPNLPLQTKLDILIDVAEGIEYLHRNGVMHLDIKHCNVLLLDEVTETSNNLRAMLADFGYACFEHPDGRVKRCGTPSFMAPETILPRGLVTHKADIFSFGILLRYVITGDHWQEEVKRMGAVRKAVAKMAAEEPDVPIKLHRKKATKKHAARLTTRGKRPPLRNNFGYRSNIWRAIVRLTKGCWQQNANDRPEIDEVVLELKRIRGLLSELPSENGILSSSKSKSKSGKVPFS